jgi:hypothetical protein
MDDLEKRITESFGNITASSELKVSTLAAIRAETQRLGSDERHVVSTDEDTTPTIITRSNGAAHRARKKSGPKRPWHILVAASLTAALVLGGSGAAYATGSAYVDVQASSSIHLTVNCFNRVIAATANDQAGWDLLSRADIVNDSYEDAINEILAVIGSDSETDVVVSGVWGNQADGLVSTTTTSMTSNGTRGYCNSDSMQVHDAAAALGMTMGTYRAYEELQSLGVDITPEECNAMTMAELRKRIIDSGGDVSSLGGSMMSGEDSASSSGDMGNGNGMGTGNGMMSSRSGS